VKNVSQNAPEHPFTLKKYGSESPKIPCQTFAPLAPAFV